MMKNDVLVKDHGIYSELRKRKNLVYRMLYILLFTHISLISFIKKFYLLTNSLSLSLDIDIDI